jgi:hypothetical protein
MINYISSFNHLILLPLPLLEVFAGILPFFFLEERGEPTLIMLFTCAEYCAEFLAILINHFLTISLFRGVDFLLVAFLRLLFTFGFSL